MPLIKLSQGLTTEVDQSDFERFNKFKWYASFQGRGENKCYAVRFITVGPKTPGKRRKRKKLWLHREIMETPPELVCDHLPKKAGDKSDGLYNRKHRLENVTFEENQRRGGGFYNRRKLK